MANIDINQAVKQGKRSFSKRHKTSLPRIDMTPMVDLGFLLITFFIFTATLSQPNALNLLMPKEDDRPTKVAESGALSIIVTKAGLLYYYEGMPSNNPSNFKQSSIANIREILIAKKKDVMLKYRPDEACEAEAVANHTDPNDCKQKNLMILIKPTNDADYKNIVALLDEMTINKINRYAITNPEKEDLYFISTLK